MTIATLIVEVIAQTASIERQLQNVNKTFDSVADKADLVGDAIGTIGRSIAGAFTVGAIVSAAKEVINFASDTQSMSDQVGIGVERVQAMNYAMAGAGITVDEMANGIAQLSRRLVGGDESAVRALDKLNLSAANLVEEAPDEAFLGIVEAVSRIPNPMQQSAIMMELFGRTGSRFLRLVHDDIRALADEAQHNGAVISKELIEKADNLDDSWDRLKIRGKALLGDVLIPIADVMSGSSDWSLAGLIDSRLPVSAKAVKDIADQLGVIERMAGRPADVVKKMVDEIDRSHPAIDNMRASWDGLAKTTIPGLAMSMDEANRISQELTKSVQEKAKASAEAARDEAHWIKVSMENNQQWAAAVEDIEHDMLNTRRDLEQAFYDDQVAMADAAGRRLLQTTIDLNSSLVSLDAERIRNLLAVNTPGMFASGSDARAAGQSWGGAFSGGIMEGINGGLSGIGNSILGALMGGGNVLKSIGSSFGLSFTQHTFGSDAFKGLITNKFGDALGGMFNSILPGIGAIAGPLLSKIGDLFGGLFGGPSKKEKEGRSASDAFTQQLAGMLDWQQQIEVHQLIAAGNSEKFAMQLVAIRDGFAKAGHTADEVNDVINRLWAAEKQGGNAVQQVIDEITIKLHDTLPAAADNAATQTLHAFDEITSAAMSAGDAVAQAATDAFNAWATTYKYINGGGSNIDPTKQALSPENYASYDDWLKAFLQFNPGDAGRAASAYGSNSFAALGGFVTASGIQYLAGGGGVWPWMSRGTDTVPAMLTPGEGVLNRDGMKALAALNRGGAPTQPSHVYVTVVNGRPDDIINAMRAKGVRFTRA